MTIQRRELLQWLGTSLLLGACEKSSSGPASGPKEVTVFAAASLRDAVTELQSEFEKSHPGAKIAVSFAGSNALARQLIAAPKADVFLSASEQWMDAVEKAGRLVPDSRQDLLKNQLVLVCNARSNLVLSHPRELSDPRFEELVLGNPDAVPAGIYAKRYLESLKVEDGSVWQAVEKRVVPMPDVRAALVQIEQRGGAIGFVYKTDAALSKKVRVLFEVPESESDPIRYPMAKIAGSPAVGLPLVDQLYSYLRGNQAKAVFERYGFRLAEQKGS
ncbi:MAG: molybdate ABC transporter substrate-binding protein [Myxococcales bacterium]|nr:molybdate ABC transporter substrate-binding protein [Myxococcales bacterium]